MMEDACIPTDIDGPYTDVAYAYDGTLEGFFTAVFQAYAHHEDPSDILPDNVLQPRLGQYVRAIQTDFALASRVSKGICTTCGMDTFNFVKHAVLCDDLQASTDAYKFIRFAMNTGKGAIHHIANPIVEPLARRSKFISYEAERMRQFVRFQELEEGIFFARIAPKAKVLPLVMDGFMARYNTQPFIIFDETHHMAGVYEGPACTPSTSIWGNCSWYLVPVDPKQDFSDLVTTDKEKNMQQAWKQFYKATTIAARYNPELRQHFMPKRFWANLIELQEDFETRGNAPMELPDHSKCISYSPEDNTPRKSNSGMKLSVSAGPSCQK